MIMNKITITEEKAALSIDLILDFLNNYSYWGKNKTREDVISSINSSMCFGLFLDMDQIGFARVVTDYTTVFI